MWGLAYAGANRVESVPARHHRLPGSPNEIHGRAALLGWSHFSSYILACLSLDAVQLKSEPWRTRETAQRLKHLLYFQRTRVWFPAPIPGYLQQPVTPAPMDYTPTSNLQWAHWHSHTQYTYTHTYRHTNLKNLFKTVNDETRLGCNVCQSNVTLLCLIYQECRRQTLPKKVSSVEAFI